MDGPPGICRRGIDKFGNGMTGWGYEWKHRPVPPQRKANGKLGGFFFFGESWDMMWMDRKRGLGQSLDL